MNVGSIQQEVVEWPKLVDLIPATGAHTIQNKGHNMFLVAESSTVPQDGHIIECLEKFSCDDIEKLYVKAYNKELPEIYLYVG